MQPAVHEESSLATPFRVTNVSRPSIGCLSSVSGDTHLHATLILWIRPGKMVFRTAVMLFFFKKIDFKNCQGV